MAVKPFLQGGTILGVVGYCSPRIIETAGEPENGGGSERIAAPVR